MALVEFICTRGCVVHANAERERVGHFCRRSVRIAGKHDWTYATRQDLLPKEAG